jgi:hypothetical protein
MALLSDAPKAFLLLNAITLFMFLGLSKIWHGLHPGKNEEAQSDTAEHVENDALRSLIVESNDLRAKLLEARPILKFTVLTHSDGFQVESLAVIKDAAAREASRDEGRAERDQEAESLRQKLLDALTQLADTQEEVVLLPPPSFSLPLPL